MVGEGRRWLAMEPSLELADKEETLGKTGVADHAPLPGCRTNVSGLADEELIGKLRRRHRMAEPDAEEAPSVAADVAAGTASQAAVSAPFQQVSMCSDEDEAPPSQARAATTTAPRRPAHTTHTDATSPQYSMGSPPRSRSSSPDAAKESPLPLSSKRCQKRSRGHVFEDSPASSEEADKLCYEWQFEILNSLPREKALDLVNHLRRSERDKAQATALALRLHRTNSELEEKLRKTQGAGLQQGVCTRRCCLWSCCCLATMTALLVGLVVVAWALLPKSGLLAGALASQGAGVVQVRLPQLDDNATGAVTTVEACEGEPHRPASIGDEGSPHSEGDGGHVRETTVREMTLRETKVTEYDATEIEGLKKENEFMRGQLQGLWKDVSHAVDKGQDMVCWKV